MSLKNSYGKQIRAKGQEIAVDLHDLRDIVKDAVSDKFESLKEGAGNALVSMRDNAKAMAQNTGERATKIVTRSPWKAMAGAAAVGLLAGFLIRRN